MAEVESILKRWASDAKALDELRAMGDAAIPALVETARKDDLAALSIDALFQLLKDDRESVRKRALAALLNLGDAIFPQLAKALKSDDPNLHRLAVMVVQARDAQLMQRAYSEPKAKAEPVASPAAPAPKATAKGFGSRLMEALGAIVATLIVVPIIIGIFYLVWSRPFDVGYKGVWIVAHWDQVHNHLCMEPLCVRMDTEKKHAFGNPGHTSETRFSYCPEHEPHFVATDTRFDGLWQYLYWFAVFAATCVIVVLPIVVLARLVCWPILIPLCLVGRIKPAALMPWVFQQDSTRDDADWHRRIDVVGGVIGGIILVAFWALYIWY